MLPFRPNEPAYAGVGITFCRTPLVLDPVGLEGVDVAILGAPFDEGVTYRPGTRFGPRAIRAAEDAGHNARPSIEVGLNPFEAIRVVDYGDIEAVPAGLERSLALLRSHVGHILGAGAVAVVLGGDHSLSLSMLQAVADRFGPDGYAVIHFDTHADTGSEVFGVALSHGTIMRRLVEDGHVDPRRYAQIGLRGYWPGREEFAWQAERGITSLFMHEVRDRGIKEVIGWAIDAVGEGPVFLTVDIDVLDPAFAPGTGTPEPGGMTTAELLWAAREVAEKVEVVGADLVEVIPTGVGSADVTALAADRIVREVLGGIALRRKRQEKKEET